MLRRTRWSPAALPGVSLWLRADDLNGQADASAVSSWVDRIGSYDFAQATGAKQPTFYKTTSARLINGQPTVHFDGVDDLLRYAGVIGSPTSGHIVIVCQMTVPAPTGNGTLLSTADEASATRQVDCVVATPVATALIRQIQRNNDTADGLTGDTALTSDTDYLLEWSSNGTTTAMRVNTTAQTITVSFGANNGDWWGDTADRDNVVLGARKNSSESLFFTGDIAEIIAVNGQAISASDRTSLSAYTTDRYGLAA